MRRIWWNHPTMIGASLEDMVAWSRLGAYIELSRGLCAGFQVPLNEIEARNIVAINGSVNKIVADSDYGQNGSSGRSSSCASSPSFRRPAASPRSRWRS